MNDAREKLLDLIIDAKRTDPEIGSFAEWLATYLIANGVIFAEDANVPTKTVQLWIPVTERLPDRWQETDEKYFGEPIEFIVLIEGAECPTVLCFDGGHFFDIHTGDYYEVSHWMPLPEPPNEYA